MKKFLFFLILVLFLGSVEIAFAQDEVKPIKPRTFVNAITKGDIDAVKDALNKGVDPNGTFFGSQFITYAIIKHQHDILDLLLERGASPNPPNEIPPLYFATSEKNPYAVAKLLKSGADVNKTYMGLTGKDLAKTYKNQDIYRIYIAYETNIKNFSPEAYKSQNMIASKVENTQKVANSKPVKPEESKLQNENIPMFDLNAIYTIEKKDPKLIKITKTAPVNNQTYKNKISRDNLVYRKYQNQVTSDQYSLYVILDKLLRSNNLQYQNWRIGLNLNPEEINAYAGSANLITINSSLYDSLYQNKDALAFIIAHELAHFVLGHHQITLENSMRIQELQAQIQSASNESSNQRYLGNLNSVRGNGYESLGNNVASLAYQLSIAVMNAEVNKIYEQERQLEIEADTEALTMLTKAGYDAEKAKEALEFLTNLPNVFTNRSTHPSTAMRLQNLNENVYLNDSSDLINQGKSAIIKTNVSVMKKSSDKKTLVLTKALSCKKVAYSPVTKHQKLFIKAYGEYLNNNYVLAQNLFGQAYVLNPNNYVPPLYLSYIHENNFKQTKQKESLKLARRWVNKAEDLNPNDINVQKQKEDIKNLYIARKYEKKYLKQQKKAEKQNKK